MNPKTSRDLPQTPPREDKAKECEDALVKDAEKTDQADRDSVHGDGEEIGIKTS